MIKILLPTDFSEHARRAFHYAVDLFGTEKVKFILYHICVPPPKTSGMLISIEDILIKEAKEQMSTELEYLNNMYGSDLDLEHFIYLGQVTEYIKQICANGNINYIVMGTKGASGLSGRVMGSNATAMLKAAPVPLFLIPDEHEPVKKEPVLISIASDLKAHLPYKNIQQFFSEGKLDPEFNIEVVHVMRKDDEDHAAIKQEIFNAFPGKNVNLTHIANEDVTDGLNEYTERKHPDILVLIRQKKNLFEKLFVKSVSRNVALSGKIPLLVFQED